MKKILFIFGTRPEAIKLASVILFLKDSKKYIVEICVTGQHRQMLDQVLSLFNLMPDYDIDLMKTNQDLYDVTANALLGIRDVIKKSKPDLIFVHGDTTTTLSGALAGFYSGVEVCHVEAGLRTFDFHKPFPEEMNRQVVGKLSKYHFCPTKQSKENLLKEHISEDFICVTGNTVIDTLDIARNIIKTNQPLVKTIKSKLEEMIYKDFTSSKYILITGHRRESFGEGFTNICRAISKLAEENADINFVYPVHMNPNVQEPVNSILKEHKNVYLIEPLEYIDFIYLLENCYFVMTDSGGIQEEAPSLGKPVLVMRETTERPEAVVAGVVKLVGSNFNKIYEGAMSLINDKTLYQAMSKSINPYGDGKASSRIKEYLESI